MRYDGHSPELKYEAWNTSASPQAQQLQRSKISERRVEDVVFLVDSDNQTVFHLNQLGAAVWHLIAEPTAVDQIVAIVQQAFPDIAPEQVETDVTKLIDDLHSRGLINRKD